MVYMAGIFVLPDVEGSGSLAYAFTEVVMDFWKARSAGLVNGRFSRAGRFQFLKNLS